MRDGDRTVLTMANDYQGEPREFAMVVPVPVVLREEQIHVASSALLDHLDAYTAPRLVEYRDDDPCAMRFKLESALPMATNGGMRDDDAKARRMGVTIEASYTVGEYDILILSAEESRGLARWLRENDYRLPEGAEPILESYLKQGMRFFVAKVNLEERERLGFANLRPLQMAFETRRFGLPIRLGTLNADGKQDLFVYTLTRTGRVETTNYRTVKLPTGDPIPPYVEEVFPDFYRDLFATRVDENGGSGVFLEYAWDMAWCDPCAADPLSAAELRELGVFWLDGTPAPGPVRSPSPQPQNVFVTRLHVRYEAESFPEDLQFQTTGDRSHFQGRYVMRHPWTGTPTCEAARRYLAELPERQRREAQVLARLTGWPLDSILERMGLPEAAGLDPAAGEPWWRRIWAREEEPAG